MRASMADSRTTAVGSAGFLSLRILGGLLTAAAPARSAFFTCNFARATGHGVSLSLSIKWEHSGDVFFHILNYLEEHFEKLKLCLRSVTNSLGDSHWGHAKCCYYYERNYMTGDLF